MQMDSVVSFQVYAFVQHRSIKTYEGMYSIVITALFEAAWETADPENADDDEKEAAGEARRKIPATDAKVFIFFFFDYT
jgi:hypothetical protein